MERSEAGMSDEEATRLTWKILEEGGIPFSIDPEGCLHFDVEAIEQQLADLHEEDDEEEDDEEDEEGGESIA